jgi:hypothetical protein
MKRIIYSLCTLVLLAIGMTDANAQRDARYDRLTIDKRLIFKTTNIDTIKADTTNSNVRLKGASKTLITGNVLYDWTKAHTLQRMFDYGNGRQFTNRNDTIGIGNNKLIINNVGTNPGLQIDFTQDGSAGTTRGAVTLDDQALHGVGFGYYGKDPGFVRNQVENTITPTEAVASGVAFGYVSTASGFTSKLTYANVIAQWYLGCQGNPFTGDSALMIRTTSAGIINAVDNDGYALWRGSPNYNQHVYGGWVNTNWGINTITPTKKLDVNGSSIFRDTAFGVTMGINDSSTAFATTQWVKQHGYGTGGGGGGGSGTVNAGSQYRLAYYATAGTAVSEGNAITANRAMISDANGVPVHSSVTNTELGYVSGVTSAIQTQITGKQASSAHLTSISGLTPTNDDIMQYKSGAWTNRTIVQLKSDLSLSGSNTGDQTITLTGNVTGSGIGSFAATIANDAVTYAKLQNISATNRILGRITAGAGDAEELTPTQVTGMLDVFTTSANGVVPAASGGSTTTQFLRKDGSWAVPTGASGVTGVGTLNSVTKSANGAVISGSDIILQTVDATNAGLVTPATKARIDSNFYLVSPTTNTKLIRQISADSTMIKALKDSTDIGFKYTDSTITAYQKLQYGHWILACSDETTAITTGTGKLTFRAPFAVTVTGVRMSLTTVSSSGIPTIDINEAGTTILSTKLTIDASEKTSTTAATAAVISDSSISDDAEITIDFDVAGTGATGVKVIIYWTRALP